MNGPLTPRQEEVVALLAEGLTVRQIAARWVVSVATIRTHVKAAEQTLDLHTLHSLVAWWWGYRLGALEAAARQVVDMPHEAGLVELAHRVRALAAVLDG